MTDGLHINNITALAGAKVVIYEVPVYLMFQYGFQSKYNSTLRLIEGKGIERGMGENIKATTCPSTTESTSETELQNSGAD